MFQHEKRLTKSLLQIDQLKFYCRRLYLPVTIMSPHHSSPKPSKHTFRLAQRAQSDRSNLRCDATSTEYLQNPLALQSHGKQLLAAGLFESAIGVFQHLVEISPKSPRAHYYLANAHQAMGQVQTACNHYNMAIALDGEIPEAHNNLGIILESAGKPDKAMDHYRRAIEITPDYPEPYVNLGNCFYKQRDFKSAEACFRQALQNRPGYAEAHNFLGKTLAQLGQTEEAQSSFVRALSYRPDYTVAFNNLGLLFQKQQRLSESLEIFNQIVVQDPASSKAHLNRGNVLREMGHFDQALLCYQQALQLKPDYAVAYYNLGILHTERYHFQNALLCYEKALEANPDYLDARRNRAFALLLTGNFRQGWQEFEWRLKKADGTTVVCNLPTWDGSSLSGQTILIEAEQGIGDQIMFASCIDQIVEWADDCIIECDARLVPLFSRSFPQATIKERFHNTSDEPKQSAHNSASVCIAMGSLPKFLRPNEESFPRIQRYLNADPGLSRKWRSRLAAEGTGPNIGISWQGGGTPYVRKHRSTTLEQWEEVLTLPNISFVNLQYGDCSNELTEIHQNMGIEVLDWEDIDPLTDLDDFAALISVLDLVISVDNSTVHLAGALGIPVWVMLPHTPDWRWLLDREDSLWYPTARLFRQTAPEQWNDLFSSVAHRLCNFETEE